MSDTDAEGLADMWDCRIGIQNTFKTGMMG